MQGRTSEVEQPTSVLSGSFLMSVLYIPQRRLCVRWRWWNSEADHAALFVVEVLMRAAFYCSFRLCDHHSVQNHVWTMDVVPPEIKSRLLE